MGTMEYYRHNNENDKSGRCDKHESQTDVISAKSFDENNKYRITNTIISSSGLLLCFFRYYNNEISKRNLLEQIDLKGRYIVVVHNSDIEHLRVLIKNSRYVEKLGDGQIIDFVHKKICYSDITYINGYSDNWTKKNIKFITEQEFRFASSINGFITNENIHKCK